MIEGLLVAIAFLIWILLRPQKDWYLVEWRFCSDEDLCRTAFLTPGSSGYDKGTCAAHKLSPASRSKRWDRAHAFLWHVDGGEIRIHQSIFADLDAARIHFDELSQLMSGGDDFQKIYIYRIVARSRQKAVTLPYEKYSEKAGELLAEHPKFMWHGSHMSSEGT